VLISKKNRQDWKNKRKNKRRRTKKKRKKRLKSRNNRKNRRKKNLKFLSLKDSLLKKSPTSIFK